MTPYHHFTQNDRIKLSALIRAGLLKKDIAKQLNKDPSSISRELKRNSDNSGNYHARIAKEKTVFRRYQANQRGRRIENDPWLDKYIIKKLKEYWSPEQIAGRVRKKHSIIICHETIYQYIYREHRELIGYLRCQKGKYRRRHGTKIREKRREECKKRRISERPEIIEKRERIGDWEGDTVLGTRKTKGIFITHVDRRSRYLLMDYVKKKTSELINKSAVARFINLPQDKRKTITYDNGKEFEQYEYIEKKTNITIYFAYPYHSWERGTNENTNGLIRQFFPKKISLENVTKEEVKQVEDIINQRPRKSLNYLTPHEVFNCGLT